MRHFSSSYVPQFSEGRWSRKPRDISRFTTLYSVDPVLDRNHDSVIRIEGLAPEWWAHSFRLHLGPNHPCRQRPRCRRYANCRSSGKNAGIQSLDEPWADTTTPAGKMIMTVFGGIAEFERSLILSRTQEGREVAMARGVAFGRPSKILSETVGPSPS